jgi:hypothetical protein
MFIARYAAVVEETCGEGQKDHGRIRHVSVASPDRETDQLSDHLRHSGNVLRPVINLFGQDTNGVKGHCPRPHDLKSL